MINYRSDINPCTHQFKKIILILVFILRKGHKDLSVFNQKRGWGWHLELLYFFLLKEIITLLILRNFKLPVRINAKFFCTCISLKNIHLQASSFYLDSIFCFCSDKKKKKKRLIENLEDEEAGVTNPSMVSMTGSNDHEHIKCKIINIADV